MVQILLFFLIIFDLIFCLIHKTNSINWAFDNTCSTPSAKIGIYSITIIILIDCIFIALCSTSSTTYATSLVNNCNFIVLVFFIIIVVIKVIIDVIIITRPLMPTIWTSKFIFSISNSVCNAVNCIIYSSVEHGRTNQSCGPTNQSPNTR